MTVTTVQSPRAAIQLGITRLPSTARDAVRIVFSKHRQAAGLALLARNAGANMVALPHR